MTVTTEPALRKRRPPEPVASPRRRSLRPILVGWSFILPNFLGFALLTLVPMVFGLALAFMDWSPWGDPEWVGFDNFERMVQSSTFWIALWNTTYYAIGHIPLTIAASLGLALLLNRALAGLGFFRTAFFLPYVTSLVAVAVVWNMLFNPTSGPVNQFLEFVGVTDPPGWTSSTTWAMPAVIVASVWRDMGYYMVLFLAGLQTIPTELYEAARVDGANAWQRFWNITLPGLRPTTFFVLIMCTVASFKVFDLIVVMTDGGPGRATKVLSQLIYEEGIREGRFGLASAISLVLFVLVAGFTVIQFLLQRRREA
jgi:multiple sugar transport system permease protein/alpha-1,4-digalacturonate transport system permease protein